VLQSHSFAPFFSLASRGQTGRFRFFPNTGNLFFQLVYLALQTGSRGDFPFFGLIGSARFGFHF
jgi:hypothetical protein